MKRNVFITTAAVIVFGCLAGCASSGIDFGKLSDEGCEIRVFEVFGMDCPGCHGGVEKLVNEVPGIRTSQGNWKQQQLHVAIEPGAEVDDEAITDAIKQANFTPGKRVE
jgi:copper chaperone CopZ